MKETTKKKTAEEMRRKATEKLSATKKKRNGNRTLKMNLTRKLQRKEEAKPT